MSNKNSIASKNLVTSGIAASAVIALCGLSARATTTVISTTVTGHASLVNSGSNNKNYWGQGNGSGVQYSGYGANAYSQATGGQINPFDLNINDAKTDIFVANLQPGGKSITVPVSGGVLTQVGKDQVYVAENFDIGTLSPTFFSQPETVSGSYNQGVSYAHFLYPLQGWEYLYPQATTTITVPTPEADDLLLFVAGSAALLLVARKLPKAG